MTKAKKKEKLLELDPEIEKTLKTIRKEKKQQKAETSKMVEQQDKPLRDYGVHNLQGFQPSGTWPTVVVNNFELKPSLLQMIQLS